MNDKTHTGGCMCGSIRYEMECESTWNVYCHCNSCRKHTGAPVSVLVCCLPDHVRWTSGERSIYESSPSRFRTFCRDCGTSLTWETEVKGNDWLAIHISTFDNPENFPPTEHVFYSHAIPWFDVNDNLPRHEGAKFREFGVRESGSVKPTTV